MRSKLFLPAYAIAIAGLFAASTAKADTFNIFVGYADNLRNSGFFPTPWLGAAGVVSQTNPAGITFDSGAVRIDNTSAVPLVISNFKVTDNGGTGSPVVFNIWGAGTQLTIPVGGIGIFTQFPDSGENFDSSDQGLLGTPGGATANLEPNNADGNGNTNLIGGCSSNASFINAAELAGACNPLNAPVISFTENGNSVSVIDSGFILNTGEWDFVNNNCCTGFGGDGNESINWNALGGNSRGGTGTVPEPTSLVLFGTVAVGLAHRLRKRSS